MNKKLLTLSISSALSAGGLGLTGAAFAQSSVNLYGVLDGGLRLSSNAGHNFANNADKSRLAANSGGKDAPRFGIKGYEDLGGGNAAFFNLEGGFNLGTGILSSNNDNKSFSNNTSSKSLFGRQAYLGLSNTKLGQVTLGRQFTVAFDTAKIFEPTNFINQAHANYDLSGTIDGVNGNKRSDASLKYTGTWKNLTLRAAIKPGNHAGSFSNGNAYAIGMSYKIGNSEFATSYSEINHHRHAEDITKQITALGDTSIFNIGGSHKIGNTTFKLGYARSMLPSIDRSAITNTANSILPNSTEEVIGLGVQHPLTPKLQLTLASYARFNEYGSSTQTSAYKFFAGTNYAVSSRTNLYAFVDHTDTDSGISISNSNRTQTGLTMGVSHSF